jgi:hypothetical protein
MIITTSTLPAWARYVGYSALLIIALASMKALGIFKGIAVAYGWITGATTGTTTAITSKALVPYVAQVANTNMTSTNVTTVVSHVPALAGLTPGALTMYVKQAAGKLTAMPLLLARLLQGSKLFNVFNSMKKSRSNCSRKSSISCNNDRTSRNNSCNNCRTSRNSIRNRSSKCNNSSSTRNSKFIKSSRTRSSKFTNRRSKCNRTN